VVPGWPEAVRRPLLILGVAMVLAGAALMTWARRALGAAFTAFPQPRAGASLVTGGPYHLARHPMYGGALLLLAGISLARSWPSLVLTAVLAVLWWRKSVVEEQRLAETYDGYAAYRSATPHRFLPLGLGSRRTR
jgi:protein-S-isoprenylcysteine O-methyltransferase Ste14